MQRSGSGAMLAEGCLHKGVIVAKHKPKLNAWYQDAQEDQIFEVIAIDDDDGTIEIQYYDGEVAELDFDSWKQMVVIPAQPPEDWRSSYELSDDDTSDADDVYVPDNWDDPLANIEPDMAFDSDDF